MQYILKVLYQLEYFVESCLYGTDRGTPLAFPSLGCVNNSSLPPAEPKCGLTIKRSVSQFNYDWLCFQVVTKSMGLHGVVTKGGYSQISARFTADRNLATQGVTIVMTEGNKTKG